MVVALAPPHHSGAGRQAAELARELVRRGGTVEILSTAPGRRRPTRDAIGPVPVLRVPVGTRGSRLDKAAFSLALAMRLLVRRYAVVHLHGSYYLLRTLARLKRPFGLQVVYKATMSGKDDAATIARHRGRALVDVVDRWICIAEPLAASARSVVSAAAIERIPNAIDLRRFAPGDARDRARLRRDLGLPEDRPVWGSVGALTPRKGFHLLVEAWGELAEPRPTLLLVGPVPRDRAVAEPDYAVQVERRITELGLDRSVRLLGAYPDVARLLRGIDGFLFASEHEGLPNAVLEALAAGLPVLSARFEAADDIARLANGRARFVPTRPDAIADALPEMPEPGVVPPGVRSLDVDVIAERYLALYRELGVPAVDAAAPLTERVDRCPACDGAVVEVFACRDRRLGLPGDFVFATCSDCGAGVLALRPTEAALPSYYPESYGPYGAPARGGSRGPLSRVIRRILLLVPALLPDSAAVLAEELRHGAAQAPRRVLDVGCGDGRHLARDVQAGWHATGVDFSPTAVGRAQRRGLDVRLGTIDRDDLARESFDLIRLSHVIEHVPDPVGLLRRARDLLAPGGRIHIATPNLASVSASLFGPYWWDLEAPRHLIVFTPDSLQGAARRAGLVVESERHEVAPSIFWASLGSWLSERPGGRRIDGRALRSQLLLRTLLYPLWWVLARQRRSERMQMVLREAGEACSA
jgi:glycosyltransferase involved in cell wall biosynthesis/SAM-dependent methyltransferase